MLAALPVCNFGLEAILSRKCFPDVVIFIKHASLIATGSLFFSTSICSLQPQKKADVWNFNAQKGEKNGV